MGADTLHRRTRRSDGREAIVSGRTSPVDDARKRAFYAGWSALADLSDHIAHGDRSTLPDVPNNIGEAWGEYLRADQEASNVR